MFPAPAPRRARTSETDPLRLDVLRFGRGRLGLTLCPGKVDPLSPTGQTWQRSLPADLDVIRDWGATVLVTLVEDHELRLLGVTDLGAEAESRGMAWVHLPIVDVSVPTRAWERRWTSVRPMLLHQLRAGGSVAVHCRGGLGRAGIVAASLLVGDGVAPAAALQRVRKVRPGAVETREQEAWVLRQTA